MEQAKAHHHLLRARSVPLQSTLKTLEGNEMKESEPSAFRFIKGKPLNAFMNPAYATRAANPSRRLSSGEMRMSSTGLRATCGLRAAHFHRRACRREESDDGAACDDSV